MRILPSRIYPFMESYAPDVMPRGVMWRIRFVEPATPPPCAGPPGLRSLIQSHGGLEVHIGRGRGKTSPIS